MTPLRNVKRNVIPESIRKFRLKNIKTIQIQEHTRGDSLKRALAIKKIAVVFKQQKASGKLTRQKLHAQAKTIDLMLTMLADEYLAAKGKQNAPAGEWNKTYLGFFKTIHKEIPIELQREIFRQIREE